tara:strand:+ start:382 stop:918 length:537 start_codon:yes stop_codon:yes gene_type:complete
VNKSEIRKKILKIRKNNQIKNQKISFKEILNILKKTKIKKKIIGGYYPFNYEIDSLHILKKFEKKKYRISLPKIRKNSQMDFFQWSLKDPLIINKYGIPEPTSNKIQYPNILLVPLVGYDKDLNRLGYGGGFYDRYIKKIKKKKDVITIGFSYSFQKIRQIKINKHDIKLDFVLTNKK